MQHEGSQDTKVTEHASVHPYSKGQVCTLHTVNSQSKPSCFFYLFLFLVSTRQCVFLDACLLNAIVFVILKILHWSAHENEADSHSFASV